MGRGSYHGGSSILIPGKGFNSYDDAEDQTTRQKVAKEDLVEASKGPLYASEKNVLIDLIDQKILNRKRPRLISSVNPELRKKIEEKYDGFYDWMKSQKLFCELYRKREERRQNEKNERRALIIIAHHQINGKKTVESLDTVGQKLQLAISKFSDPYDWAKNQKGFNKTLRRLTRVHKKLIISLIDQKFYKVENPKINVKTDTELKKLLFMEYTDLYDWAEKHPLFEGSYDIFANRSEKRKRNFLARKRKRDA